MLVSLWGQVDMSIFVRNAEMCNDSNEGWLLPTQALSMVFCNRYRYPSQIGRRWHAKAKIRAAFGVWMLMTGCAAPCWAQNVSAEVAPVEASTLPVADIDTAALAQKLSNPVASLISVPFQLSFDGEIGPARNGNRETLNVQPVIPFKLSSSWNLISRTIMPVIGQHSIFPGSGNQFGLGDTVQSLFFSPAEPKHVIWGAGPVILLPSGTSPLLSSGKWGAGPSLVVLKQSASGVTYGGLVNHIWSFAGNSARNDISVSFANPFVSRTTKKALTYSASADITYDWKSDRWTMPLSVNVSQLTRLGSQLVSIGGSVRYYVVANELSPHGVAGRLSLTLLFPKK